MATDHEGWLTRVQLLDDLPIEGDGRDFLGLESLARSLADSLFRGGGRPLVIHVDGAWGRGKTSFCESLRRRLINLAGQPTKSDDPNIAQEIGTAWYVASDHAGRSSDEVMYQVLRAVVPREDPEEIASLMARFASEPNDPASAEPLFDAFRGWLRRELGWGPQRTAISARISLSGGEAEPLDTSSERARSVGALSLAYAPRARKLAVVFIDDLDRCSPKWVSRLLDSVRRYVTCQGVVFVIAADRRVVAAAFDDVVQALGVEDRLSGAEALEKYVRHSVRIPAWRISSDPELGRKLRDLQCALDKRGELLPVLTGPGPDLQFGLGFKLALYLPESLGPRRLKRVLNRFALELARFADLAGVGPEHLALDAGLWRELRRVKPCFGEVDARPENYPAYFFGRLMRYVLEELWPEALHGVELGGSELDERVRALAGLGNALQAEGDASLPGLSLRLFARAIDVLVPASTSVSTPLGTKRECCELLASVYADLERNGAFSPRRASAFLPTTVTVLPEPPGVTSSADTPPPQPQAAEEIDNASALLHEVAEELEDVRRTIESVSGLRHAPAVARATLRVRELPAGWAEAKSSHALQTELDQWAALRWPQGSLFGAIEFADELVRHDQLATAYGLLSNVYQATTAEDALDGDALRWAALQRLARLATAHSQVRQRLSRLADFPPISPPDSGAAFRAAFGLLILQSANHAPLTLQPDFTERVLAPLIALINLLPKMAWPARVFLEAVPNADARSLPTLRQIAQRVKQGDYALTAEERAAMIMRLVVPLRASTGDQGLAFELYQLLGDRLPAGELHNVALLLRALGDFERAGLYWETAYGLGSLSAEGKRELQGLIEERGLRAAARAVQSDAFLPAPIFEGVRPSVRTSEPPPFERFELESQLDPLDALSLVRDLGVINAGEGVVVELAGRLLRATRMSAKARTRLEADAWADASWFAGRAPAALELACVMIECQQPSAAWRLVEHARAQCGPSGRARALDDVFASVALAALDPADDEASGKLVTSEPPVLTVIWERLKTTRAPLSWMESYLTNLGAMEPRVLPPGWIVSWLLELSEHAPVGAGHGLVSLINAWLGTSAPGGTWTRDLRLERLAKRLVEKNLDWLTLPELQLIDALAMHGHYDRAELMQLAHAIDRLGDHARRLQVRLWLSAYLAGAQGPWALRFSDYALAQGFGEVVAALERGEPLGGAVPSELLFPVAPDRQPKSGS